MKLLRLLAASIALFSIAGCATPPGKLTEEDFVSKTVAFSEPLPEVLGNFYEGLRYCGPHTGAIIFVTHHGIPECSPPRANGSVTCDLYMGSVGGGRSDFVLGRADFIPTEARTVVKFHVQTDPGWGDERIFSAWEKFAAGNAEEVCPE